MRNVLADAIVFVYPRVIAEAEARFEVFIANGAAIAFVFDGTLLGVGAAAFGE